MSLRLSCVKPVHGLGCPAWITIGMGAARLILFILVDQPAAAGNADISAAAGLEASRNAVVSYLSDKLAT